MRMNAVGVLARDISEGPNVEPLVGGQPAVSILGYRASGWARDIPTYEVETCNHIAEADLEGYARVTAEVQELMAASAAAGVARSAEPVAGPGSSERLAELSPVWARMTSAAPQAWQAWRDLVPSDVALLPIRAPHAGFSPEGHPTMPPDQQGFFRHTADAVGIRSRDAVTSELITCQATPGGSWLGLKCGTALPLLQSAAACPLVTVDLIDYDAAALGYASALAKALGLADRVRCTHADLVDLPDLSHKVRHRAASYDVVDLVGLLGYLPEQPRTAEPFIPSIGQFLRLARELAAPGALIVFSNLLSTHPQLEFSFNVLQWPYVKPRSLDDLAQVVIDAGIAADNVSIYTPDDGVFAVVAIRVPG